MTVVSLLIMVLGIQGNNDVKAATQVAPPASINQIFPDADLAEGIRAELQKIKCHRCSNERRIRKHFATVGIREKK